MIWKRFSRNISDMGRQAEAAELKGLAILLASNASSYISGQGFIEDGGQTAKM